MGINKPTKLLIHHTGGSDSNPLQDSSNFTFSQCDLLHKERFFFKSQLGFYCGYHYYIEKDGTIYQARSDYEEGAHTIGQNLSSIGICLAGNFDVTLPTYAQTEALKGLMINLLVKHSIYRKNIYPHRAFAHKTCYGWNLLDTWARDLIDEKLFKTKLEEIIASLKAQIAAFFLKK